MKNNFILFSIIGLSILIGYFLGNENEFHYREIGGDEKINRVERLLNYIENVLNSNVVIAKNKNLS